MTHDELLAKLSCTCCASPQELALRAVAELHNPWEGARMNGGGHNGPWCSHCEEVFDGSIAYPCPTIQAIEKALP